MSEKSNFQQTALSKGEVTAPKLNPSNNTISPAQIAQNANLSDIFSFEFKANKLPFLLSNTVVNKQKAITAIYTKAKVEKKPIQLILDSRSAGSIIIYQLIQQLQKTVDRPAQTVIVTTNGIKKTPVEEIDNFLFTINEITILVKVLVMDVPQYQALNNTPEYLKTPVFEFEEEKELPITETFMALGSTSSWAKETEQEIFEKTREWNVVRYSTPEPRKQPPYISLKCKDCNKKLLSMKACIFPEEKYQTCICYFCKACYREQFEYPKRRKICDQTCQYALSISEKVKKRTLFNAAYNSAINKLYYYSHNAKIIFDLAMALINGATQENCLECYALSISLSSKNNQEEIKFGEHKPEKKSTITPIYLTKNQPAIQLKYFDNNGKRIKPEKAHEIDAEYNLKYPDKDTLVLQPKSLTKINLRIALKISPGAIIQSILKTLLLLQNETDKPFRIKHAEKIAQAIYLFLINISDLQSVNNREQLGKSERETQGFVPVNIALNVQNESHQTFQLFQPITISPFGEHQEIYTYHYSTNL
ncbi:hypothetical protein G9A89_018201 [Geosiphon pyriformis]|nr:hypothetical protein G9A89_018201 [Geosiphon pyriformis]